MSINDMKLKLDLMEIVEFLLIYIKTCLFAVSRLKLEKKYLKVGNNFFSHF